MNAATNTNLPADVTAREFDVIDSNDLDLAGYLRFRRHAAGLPRMARRDLLAVFAAFEVASKAAAASNASARLRSRDQGRRAIAHTCAMAR